MTRTPKNNQVQQDLQEIHHEVVKTSMMSAMNKVFGVMIMIIIGYQWSEYLKLLHENQMWFTNIKQVEREISFRTEQGLYYSYFKHLTSAPSFWTGIDTLTRDNITEHTNTINIFYRFNILQELFLAAVYKIYSFHLEPIMFYINVVFKLQGFFLCVMFGITWAISGTWLAGVLTSAFVCIHRLQVTRVEYTMALREHFSLPFMFAHFLASGQYFNDKIRENEKSHLIKMYILVVMYTSAWQFAQFVILLQSVVIFGLATIGIIEKKKASNTLLCFACALLTCWYLSFYQPMLVNSLAMSFIPVAMFLLQADQDRSKGKPLRKLFGVVVTVGMALAASVAINTSLKLILNQNADNHIFQFVRSKFGFHDPTDFESRLYLCLGAFQPIPWSEYGAMSENFVLPLAAAIVVFFCMCILLTVWRRWTEEEKEEDERNVNGAEEIIQQDDGPEGLRQRKRTSEDPKTETRKSVQHTKSFWDKFDDSLAFMVTMDNRPATCLHVGYSIVFFLLAATTLRMRCLSNPYLCIFAGAAVANFDLYKWIAVKIGDVRNKNIVNLLRHIVVVFAIVLLFLTKKEPIYKELEQLREFYDPDTVELMEWINTTTPETVAFTGSMQLLAGVKLCTGRHITNHPHFEDKGLRDRTKELYAIYGKVSAREVWKILRKYDSSYIILEDSICLRSTPDRCGLTEVMDITLGHLPDDGVRLLPHLRPSKHPRFCNEIRFMKPPYSKYFQLVMANKTFRVYRVIANPV